MTKLSYDERCDLNERCEAFFKMHHDEYGRRERVKPDRRLSGRSDLNAFSLLDQLLPGMGDIVGAADHDEIWLSVQPYDLMKIASEEDLLDLIRCGVRYDSGLESLCMFV